MAPYCTVENDLIRLIINDIVGRQEAQTVAGARRPSYFKRLYGDSLAEPDPLFWANKLHFYISDLSFYNFPYLFGYLFSLGVYARREAAGDEFFPRYQALLEDTGRTTAEELARKHLDVDLTQPAFWRDTIRMLESRIDHFETLVEGVAG